MAIAVQLGIEAALREEFVMASGLDDPALLQDDDPVRVPDGRQAMGDDEAGAPRQQHAERALDFQLREAVDVRRRLVEDQDLWIGGQRSGAADNGFCSIWPRGRI